MRRFSARLPGRRALFTLWTALNPAVMSPGMFGLGTTPTTGAAFKSGTAFIALRCNILGGLREENENEG